MQCCLIFHSHVSASVSAFRRCLGLFPQWRIVTSKSLINCGLLSFRLVRPPCATPDIDRSRLLYYCTYLTLDTLVFASSCLSIFKLPLPYPSLLESWLPLRLLFTIVDYRSPSLHSFRFLRGVPLVMRIACSAD